MLFSPGGELKKMFLKAYTSNSPDRKPVTVRGKDRFSFQVNPETIKRSYSVAYANECNQAAGITSQPGTFHHINPESFQVDILFDSSGVIKSESLLNLPVVNPFGDEQPEDVTEQVESLMGFCYSYQSDIHRPYFIMLCWGDEAGFFFGVVKSLEIDYKLFRNDGKPIRAVVHLTLEGAETPDLMKRKMSPGSPDITHEKVFHSGNEFSNMANEIYQNDSYYLDVAKANGLLSFRNIKEGTVLKFPPLK
jgi:hypothetical protein